MNNNALKNFTVNNKDCLIYILISETTQERHKMSILSREYLYRGHVFSSHALMPFMLPQRNVCHSSLDMIWEKSRFIRCKIRKTELNLRFTSSHYPLDVINREEWCCLFSKLAWNKSYFFCVFFELPETTINTICAILHDVYNFPNCEEIRKIHF